MNPWPQRFGWMSLGLGILCLLAFFIYAFATPLTYSAILHFQAYTPPAAQIEADFASRIAAHNPSVSLTQIPLTHLFEIRGSGHTPEVAARLANDAYAMFKAVPWGKDFEIVDRAEPPVGASWQKRIGALVLGLMGFIGLGLPGLWLIARARRNSAPPPFGTAPNPWPHRLFWLFAALVALPAAALVAGVLAPALSQASGGLGGITAGLVPMTVGALLVWLFWKTRPTAAQAKPREQWNPWPKRIFGGVLLLLVLPACMLLVGLIVPQVVAKSRRAAAFNPWAAPTPAPVTYQMTEQQRSDSELSTTWQIVSPGPAGVHLRFYDDQKVARLTAPLGTQEARGTVSLKLTAAAEGRETHIEYSVGSPGSGESRGSVQFPVVFIDAMQEVLATQSKQGTLRTETPFTTLATFAGAPLVLRRIPDPEAPPSPPAVVMPAIRFKPITRTGGPGWFKLRWVLESPGPGAVRLTFNERSVIHKLEPTGEPGIYGADITVLYDRPVGEPRVTMTVTAEGKHRTGLPPVPLPGDPDAVLAKANELVAGELVLTPNAPVWIAFGGLEQVRIEMLPEAPAWAGGPVFLTNGGLLTSATPVRDSVVAAELELAKKRLLEVQKRVELGMVAPGGKEVLDAELAVAEAQSKLQGDPRIAAEARLDRAGKWLAIVQRMHEAGRATTAEVDEAVLEAAQAKAAVEALPPKP